MIQRFSPSYYFEAPTLASFCGPQSISYSNLYIFIYFSIRSDPFKTEKAKNGHHSINLTDDVCSPSKPVKTEGRKLIRGAHIMLFPQNRNTTTKIKGPKRAGMSQ